MNSIKHKFQYRFMIHNYEELKTLTEAGMLNRRFAISEREGVWEGFSDIRTFTTWNKVEGLYDFKKHGYLIRVYFSNEHNLIKFKKKVEEQIGTWFCGNDNCSLGTECKYFIENCNNDKIEFLWRCIKHNEEYYCYREYED